MTVTLIAPAGVTLAIDRSGNVYTVAADRSVVVDVQSVSDFINQGFELSAGGISGITNADIAAAAGIAYSKLTLTGSIVNADVATGAAITYAKLALTGSVVNADVATGAAIAYAKLALTGAIVNADIGNAAAIASSKLADGPTATPTAGKIALYDGSGNLSGATALKVGANAVVGARGAAIPDAAGGTIIDIEARAALNTALALLRTWGAIAAV